MPTKYGVVFWRNGRFNDYTEASDFARHNTSPGGECYVVRIVPVAVFTAKVVMEPVAQPEADVVNFVG